MQFWTVDGKQWPLLRKIALNIFSMACSSASSERNFSTMGFIHTKLRNRLGKNKVEKLVYIKTNVPQFVDGKMDYSASEESSDESDAKDA